MRRRLLVLGVCLLFQGPAIIPAWSADTSVWPGQVRQVGQSCRRCPRCGRSYSACGSGREANAPWSPACGPCPPAYGPAGPTPAPGVPADRARPPADRIAPEVEGPGPGEGREEGLRGPEAAPPSPTAPPPTAPPPTAPPPGAVAAAPTSVAPNMIGDYFRAGGGALDIYAWSYMHYCENDVFFPNPGAVVGGTKIAENTSPLPQDRVFFNYSFFDNTPLYPGGVNVSRFTPGFEKTFCCGNASFEVRVPMAVTLDSLIVLDEGPDRSHGELGNLALTPKFLLCRGFRGALSAGMTITVPTADDVDGVLADGTHLARIENEAVHLMPFVGWLWTPNPCWFAHGFLQYDVAANGNAVAIDREPGGAGLERVGSLNDAAFQYLDVGIGFWAYRTCAPVRCAWLRSVALTAELHWNKSLEAGDFVEQEGDAWDGGFVVGNTAANVDVWDATVGMHVRLCDTTISLAYVTPIGGGADQPFDGEFRLTLNRWFGRSSQAYGDDAYAVVFP